MTTPRVAILAGLFVAGGLAGAGGVALLTVNDAESVALIAGEQAMFGQGDVGPSGGLEITIDVYNPHERSLSVEPLAVGGWETIDGPSAPVNAAPHVWTAVPLEAIPDCEGDVEGTVAAAVDGTVRELELTGEVVGYLDQQRERHCGVDGIVLRPTIESRSWDGDNYILDVRVPAHGRQGLGDVTIDAIRAGVPYAVEADGLPATLPVEGSITFTTRWTFDCDPEASDFTGSFRPGDVAPYQAMYLTTRDDVQIYADVSFWLSTARLRACPDER